MYAFGFVASSLEERSGENEPCGGERPSSAGAVLIRTHRGSGERSITRDDLRAVAHLCQERAAAALHVGNTRFKSACRELGVKSWPYRRIKSVRSLKGTLLQNLESSPDGASASQLMAMLDAYEAKLFDNPTEPLDSLFKTMRQAAYKRKHGRRARGEEEDDGSQEEDPENPDTPTRAGARPSSTLESQKPPASAMDSDGVLDL